jgi:hypothetical protein
MLWAMGLIAYVVLWIVMPQEPLALPPAMPVRHGEPPRATAG